MKLNEVYSTYKSLLKESVQKGLGNAKRESVTKKADEVTHFFHHFKDDGVLISDPEQSRVRVYMRISEEPLTLSECKEYYPTSNKRVKGIWYLPLKTDICRYLPCLKSYSDLNKFVWMEKRASFNDEFTKKGLPIIEDKGVDESEYWTGSLSEYGKYGNNINFFGWGYCAPNPIYKHGTQEERKLRAILFCKV